MSSRKSKHQRKRRAQEEVLSSPLWIIHVEHPVFDATWVLGDAHWVVQIDPQDPGNVEATKVHLPAVTVNGIRARGFLTRLRGLRSSILENGESAKQQEGERGKSDDSEGGSGMNWHNSHVLVSGGTSFIGSALVDALLARGSKVRVVDNLSSGKLENIQKHVNSGMLEFIASDLLEPEAATAAVREMDIVFHLAADHGGRGYVDLHQTACATNLILDGLIFRACCESGVKKVVYASSGCVYPNHLQNDPKQILYLTEDKAGPPYDADNMYGWAKLMAEMSLQAYYRERGMKSASCRYFTVYGERGHENHAVIAMIARAFVKQDPFVVWGNGEQIRNWTYVGDIVSGTIRAAEVIEDGTAVNLGTMERTRVLDAVNEVLRYTGHKANIELHPEMPTGPMNRVADNSLAHNLLGWEPQVKFIDGLHRTIDWYFRTKKRPEVAGTLEQMLTERTPKEAVRKEERRPREPI
jgi:nucleoside-diphosphate-sugar epimerase